MISRKCDYSYLLDELRNISNNYYIDSNGDVINKKGEVQNDSHIVNDTKFYVLYCMAYKYLDEFFEGKKTQNIDKEFVNRALTSYGMFNYFINNCIGEYHIYSNVGTGNITYIPYQPLADFFFTNDLRKELLMNFLKTKLTNVFDDEIDKKRVN